MTGYLVMCATCADDLIMQRFPDRDGAEDYADSLVEDADFRRTCLTEALDAIGRDWSDPQCVYLVHLGAQIAYEFRDEWQIS